MFHLFTRFNSSMQKFFMGKSKKNVANGNAAASSEMEDGNTSYDYVWDDDPSSPLLSAGKVNQTGWVPETILCQEIRGSVALTFAPFCWTNDDCFSFYSILLKYTQSY